MSNKLSEMSLEELWQLFPIILTEHNDCRAEWFEDEKKNLQSFLPHDFLIYHIGSTYIKGIYAKPIIDILIEMPDGYDFAIIKDLMKQKNYILMSEDESRISFNKGYTENGFAEKVFHLHFRQCGDNDELYFRDYLADHADVAKEYEALKLSLWKKFEHNRNGYTDAKTEFIKKYTDIAKNEYGLKYENITEENQ